MISRIHFWLDITIYFLQLKHASWYFMYNSLLIFIFATISKKNNPITIAPILYMRKLTLRNICVYSKYVIGKLVFNEGSLNLYYISIWAETTFSDIKSSFYIMIWISCKGLIWFNSLMIWCKVLSYFIVTGHIERYLPPIVLGIYWYFISYVSASKLHGLGILVINLYSSASGYRNSMVYK